jgi:thiopurine S-methyltransferase
LVPGCGRGHEAALLADLGYEVIGLDFSGEAIERAQAVQGSDRTQLRWLQADLFDGAALAAAGITTGSLQGVLEHTCFCAIDPAQREAYLDTVARLLVPGEVRGYCRASSAIPCSSHTSKLWRDRSVSLLHWRG